MLHNLRRLEAAEGYATLGLYLMANHELEMMRPETRQWPEVLAVKLVIFDGLKLWDMVDVTALQLRVSANGNPRWISVAESASREMLAARRRERLWLDPVARDRVTLP